MSILRHLDATADERKAYLKRANEMRQAEGVETDGADEVETQEIELSQERFDQMAAEEEFILTISEQGFGKSSSVSGYRLTGRGGKGIWAVDIRDRNKATAASFPEHGRASSRERVCSDV